MEVNPQYHFQRISENHVPDIVRLHRLVFSSKITEEELTRIFDTRIFGKFTIGFMAIAETGEVAAYYGVFPITGIINETPVLVAQSGATMTHPNHQKKGLFITLAKMTFDAARQEGIRMVFGFPNKNSLPGFQRKLNWLFQSELNKVVLKTESFPVCELASKNRLINKIYIAIMNRRLTGQRVKSTDISFKNTSILHSNQFLEYKLRDPGVHLIEKNGIVFLVKSRPHLLIGAVYCKGELDKDIFRQTLNELGKIYLASKVVIQFTANHWLASMFELSETKPSLPVGYIYFENSEKEVDLEFSFCDLDTF